MPVVSTELAEVTMTRLEKVARAVAGRLAVTLCLCVWACVAASVLAAAPAVASPPGAVSGSAVVVSGPDHGSSTQAGSGDRVQWSYTLDPQSLTGPSASTTFAVGSPQAIVPGSALVPPGDAVQYSSNGYSYSGVLSSASRYMRVSGPLPQQSAGAAINLAPPGISRTMPGSGSGDGYIPILTSDRVFNGPHNSPMAIDCHEISDATKCSGYVFVPTYGGHTVNNGFGMGYEAPIGWIDPSTHYLWVAGQRTDPGHTQDVGWACIDIGTDGSAPSNCGWISGGTDTDVPTSGGYSNGRMYAMTSDGQIWCLDPSANGGAGAACTGYPVSTGLSGNPWETVLSPLPGSTRMIARVGTTSPSFSTTLACFDTATDSMCSGWGTGAAGQRAIANTGPGGATHFMGAGEVLPVQTSGTSWDGFCQGANDSGTTLTPGLVLYCYRLSDGASIPAPAGLANTKLAPQYDLMDDQYGVPATFGHRLYFTMLTPSWDADEEVCYDFSANNGTGGVCPHYPYDMPGRGGAGPYTPSVAPGNVAAYGVAVDSTGSCLWALGDADMLAAGSTADPSQPCTASTSTTSVQIQPAVAYCGQDHSGSSWGDLRLRGLSASDYSSGTLTITGLTGAVVSGYDHIPVPSNGVLDISSIPKSGNTATITVTVNFAGVNAAKFGTGAAQLEVDWSGGAASQVCLDTTPSTGCATTQANQLSVGATATFSDLVTGPEAPTQAGVSLSRTDSQPAGCAYASPLSSTGTGSANQSVTLPIPSGGSVTLLDAQGNPQTMLTVPGEGTYALDTATGIVTFVPAPGVHGTGHGVTYEVQGSSGSLQTSTSTPTVMLPPPPSAPALASTGTAGAGQQQQLTVPQGDTVTLLDAGGNPTNTVTVRGQGTYTLDPLTGLLTFTPAAGFTGTTSGVRYRITDAYGQQTTGAYTPTVAPAPKNPGKPPIHHRPHPSLMSRKLSLVTSTGKVTTRADCRLNGAQISHCKVLVIANVNGRPTVIGQGSTAGKGHNLRVGMRLSPLGRTLAGQPGGVRGRLIAIIHYSGSAVALTARTRTRLVMRSTLVPRPVFFDSASADIRPGDMRYLLWLKTKLAGVKRVVCTGYTDSRSGVQYNLSLGLRRAQAVCAVLTRGTHLASVEITRGKSSPFFPNTSAANMQLNRRTEIRLNY
jgi:CshA-type fibril repeat protein